MNFSDTTPFDALVEKWSPVLDHNELPSIEDNYRKKVTAAILENQETALREQAINETAASTNVMGGNFSDPQVGSAGNLAGYDPVLISLVRRSMPNLMAYDIAGVQPMSAPTGLIFAMRARYDDQEGSEALYQEAFSKFSGEGNTSEGAATAESQGIDPTSSPALAGFRAMLTATGEGLGADSGTHAFKEMAFSIERVAVQARTRALKAEYTTELAQDLKAVHGLDAETELANILSTEILAEINRELLRTIYTSAESGAQHSDLVTGGGTYDLLLDSDGRWSAERFRGLMFQIERECNVIAKKTRRGKGNFIICSSDVASALAMGGFLNISPALNVNLDVDDTGNTFVGVLNGKTRVYIDPYVPAGADFVCVGYRGSSPYDAGIFYCPYVPLQMVRAVGETTFQPKIGFKTRYGMVANPFSKGATAIDGDGLGNADNVYYRLFTVGGLHGHTGGFWNT